MAGSFQRRLGVHADCCLGFSRSRLGWRSRVESEKSNISTAFKVEPRLQN